MARAKHSPISPLMVRAAREAVGVSQRSGRKIFGGGPTAFYKYETAKAVPSEGMANLLRLALEQPDLFTNRRAERPTGLRLRTPCSFAGRSPTIGSTPSCEASTRQTDLQQEHVVGK